MFWSVYSNQYISRTLADEHEFPMQMAAKGVNFVLTTGAVLYLVLRRAYTARRAAEFVSHETFERFSLVARAASDAMWDWDLRNNRVWRSEGYSKLFGYTAKELPAVIESWIDRLHPDDQDRVVTGLRRAARSTQQLWTDEYRFRTKDGRYLDVADRAYVLRDPKGEPIRVIGGMTDITTRRRAEQELRQSRERLRALSVRLQSLREEERTRISREIHDELGQLLTGIKIDLRWVEDRLSTDDWPAAANPILDRIVQSTELVDRLTQSVRRIASELRPDLLDSLGLLNALQFELSRFSKLSDVEGRSDLPDDLPPLPVETRTAVFRIFQETLTNIARHAKASCVDVSLRLAAGRARLQVRDDGQGMDLDNLVGADSLGILGMQERASLLGGTLQIESSPGEGTTVSLDFPLPSAPPDPVSPSPDSTAQ
jgi:two-component system sensor histidine kinase UhpB